jgi:hypothetical protein
VNRLEETAPAGSRQTPGGKPMDLQHKMIAESDRHFEVMEDLTDDEVESYVRNVVDTTAIVFGSFPDPSQPEGVSTYIIKGAREVQTTLATRCWDQFSMTAIPCGNIELAIAAAEVYGDGFSAPSKYRGN